MTHVPNIPGALRESFIEHWESQGCRIYSLETFDSCMWPYLIASTEDVLIIQGSYHPEGPLWESTLEENFYPADLPDGRYLKFLKEMSEGTLFEIYWDDKWVPSNEDIRNIHRNTLHRKRDTSEIEALRDKIRGLQDKLKSLETTHARNDKQASQGER